MTAGTDGAGFAVWDATTGSVGDDDGDDEAIAFDEEVAAPVGRLPAVTFNEFALDIPAPTNAAISPSAPTLASVTHKV